jgi:hypothetical protein
MQVVEQTQVEEVSTDHESLDVSIEAGVSVETNDLQARLGEMADDFDVTGFKCVKCGLVHMHDTTKHRLSDTFDVSESDAASMDYNSTCHCGVQEAGRHGSDLGIDEGEAASIAESAPIPPESSRELDEAFGSL